MTEHQELNFILAARLREFLWAASLTQCQVAELAEVDERTIRRILAGKGATTKTLGRIAHALHVTASALLNAA